MILVTHVMTKEAIMFSESKTQEFCSFSTEGKIDDYATETDKARYWLHKLHL